jgi:hypothetical protein
MTLVASGESGVPNEVMAREAGLNEAARIVTTGYRGQRRFIICIMNSGPRDVAQIRLANALALFDEFVYATIKHPDAATLRGLEGRFAERLQIQPSYWSQIKSRSRQIGERLARQFEQLCHKPPGWMDEPHGIAAPGTARTAAAPARSAEVEAPSHLPQDDDERFMVGLVLTYYRRHPQRARTRLLDLLGEVLTPAVAAPSAGQASQRTPVDTQDNADELWARTQAGVAPLKRKR